MAGYGFEDTTGRWWPLPALAADELTEAYREAKAERRRDREPGESREQFALRRVLEWAISEPMTHRGMNLRHLRFVMPWPVVVQGLDALQQQAEALDVAEAEHAL